jgi:hypothetical protein
MDNKCSIQNVDCPSVLKIELHVPRRDMEENQGNFLKTVSKMLTSSAVLFLNELV